MMERDGLSYIELGLNLHVYADSLPHRNEFSDAYSRSGAFGPPTLVFLAAQSFSMKHFVLDPFREYYLTINMILLA